MKTISSAQTLLIKVVFPIGWIAIFGFIMIGSWFGTSSQKGGATPADAMTSFLPFLMVCVVGAAYSFWICARLKRIRVDSEKIYMSNYRKEISVPLSEISDVTENRWVNMHPVTIHFRRDTAFGQRVMFMPAVRPFAFFSSHPVVAELKRLAGNKGG